MNVKFSTLLAGGLLALSTSAFATDAAITGKLTSVATADLVSGNTYFIVTDDDGTLDASGTVFLGLKNAVTEGEVAAFNKAADSANDADLTVDNKKIKWVVSISTVASEKIYTFTNVETGTKLTFGTDGVMKVKKSEAVESGTSSSYLTGVAGGKFTSKLAQSTPANNELTIATSGTTLSGSGKDIYFFQQNANTNITAARLNGLMGNGFMFSFPDADPAPASNPFGSKLTAVYVKSSGWNATPVVEPGLYFVSSLASEALDDNGEFVSKTKFDASTFVAVSTLGNYEINGLDPKTNGDGFKFTTVKGEDLVKTPTKGKTRFDNAIFTVSEPDPENGKNIFTMTVKPFVAYGEDVDETDADINVTVNVVAFTTMGASYVTTLKTIGSEKATNKLAVNDTNVLAAEDLLKSDAPAVFNIQFTSNEDGLKGDKSSEYGKYLGIYSSGSYELLAQGSAFLDLDAPQNQWYVSDVKNSVFTFTNRESNQDIHLQLRKTSKAGIYDVVSTDADVVNYAYIDKNGLYQIERASAEALRSGKFQIKLIAATITKNAGYLDLSKEELAQPIQIKFTVANKLLSKNMYVVANTTTKTVSLTEDEDLATLWDVIKFAAKEDSISGKIKYAYMKDEKTMDYKEVVDKAITTYALKINGESEAWYLDYPNQLNGAGGYDIKRNDKVAKAQRYILKENKNGSIYLIEANVATSNAYDQNIEYGTDALTVGGNAVLNTIGIYGAANDGVRMEFESVELLSTSLEAEPCHASFQSVNGGFLGMDENNNAIIAATQEESKTLTFWLDTTDVKELTTNFYISQAMPEGLKAAKPRMFLFNPVDSTSYYDESTASNTKDYSYMLSDKATTKAIFKAATLINKDSINTVIKGEEVGLNKDNGLNRFKFQIKEVDDEEYVIAAGDKYLSSINGKVGLAGDLKNALVVTLGEGDATANEAIEAAGVQVVAGKGAITVQGAAGKVITVANILGQTIANQVAASDNVTIAAPAGVVVVAVDGDATKVVVK